MVGNAVPHFIDRMPYNFFDIDRGRVQNVIGLRYGFSVRRIADRSVVALRILTMVHIKTEQKSALTSDQQNDPSDPRLACAFLSNMRAAGVSKDIHNAPRMIRLVTTKFVTQRSAPSTTT